MKILSHILAKSTLNDSKSSCFNILNDQGFLRHDFLLKLKSEYFPLLLEKSQLNIIKYDNYVHRLNTLVDEIQLQQAKIHQFVLKAEFDRKQKIFDDKEALKHQRERERQERRQKRKKIRVYVAKKEFKGII